MRLCDFHTIAKRQPSIRIFNSYMYYQPFLRNDLNSLTSSNIHLLPGSPTQNGIDSILMFYAELPNGRILPRRILGTIFAKQQEQIFSLPSDVEDLDDILVPVGERENLTVQQRENRVPISVLNLPVRRVSVKSELSLLF